MVQQQEQDLNQAFPALKKACRCRCLSMYFHGILSGEQPEEVAKDTLEQDKTKPLCRFDRQQSKKKNKVCGNAFLSGKSAASKDLSA